MIDRREDIIMYHEIEIITVFSMFFDIQEILNQNLVDRDYQIQTMSELENGWGNSDIIICDLPVSNLFTYRQRMKSGAYLIYIYDLINDPCLDYYEQADEVIARPLNLIYLKKRFQLIYEMFKQREELWLTNTYLNVLIDSMPDLVWFKDNNGIHIKVNKVFCHTVGKKKTEIEGKDHCSVWDVDVDDCAKTENIVRKEQKTCQFNELVKCRHGLRQFRTYKSPLFDCHGKIMGTVGIGHDITDLENMSTEMEILLNSMPYAILIRDKDGIILNVNNKFEEYFGIMKEKIIGVAYSDWYKTLTLSFDCIERKTDDKVFISCGKIERILEISYEKIHDIFKSNVGELCIYRDTTEEYLLEQQLSSNSNTDFLTGLYNRRYFYEYYSNRHDFEQISILYVDLDCFKSVNDTYGHQIGDEALKISSQVLQELFPNDLIARLGGDEFLVSKKEIISVQQLIEQGNNLIRLLKQRFEKNKYYHNLSASVGISYTNDKNKKIDDLIKESDTALYKAKQTGKSKCCIYKN